MAEQTDDQPKNAATAAETPPARTFERAQWDAAIREATAEVDLPDAEPGAAAPDPGPDPAPETDAFELDAELQPEALPKCLTERWDDTQAESVSRSGGGLPAQRRDKGSYRWPFRRLRATIDHDHAATGSERGAGRRTRRVGGFDRDAD